MSVKRIENIDQFESLREAWNGLVSETDSDNIFLTFEWIFSWWQIFGAEKKLSILTIYDEQELIGIVPLMIENMTVSFIGNPNADYADFIGADKESIISQTTDYLIEHNDGWTRIDLSQIPHGSKSKNILSEYLRKKKIDFEEEEIETVYSFQFDGKVPHADFKLRKGSSFKRFSNFFKKANGLSFEVMEDLEEIEYWLAPFFQCHTTRWSNIGRRGKYLNPDIRKLHHLLAKNLVPLKRLLFIVLKHGDIPLAYLYGYRYNDTVSLYNIANESYFQRKSPGIILLHNLVDSFIKQGYNKVDFSRGGGSHKERFVNQNSSNYRYLIYKKQSDLKKYRFKKLLKNSWPLNRIKQADFVIKCRYKLAEHKLKTGKIWPVKLVVKLLKKITSPIIEYHKFIIFAHTPGGYYDGTPDINVEIRSLEKLNIELIANFYGISQNSGKEKTLQSRFDKKCDCNGLIHNGRIVAIIWGLYHDDFDRSTGFSLKWQKDQVVSSDALTAELYRGQGLSPYLMAQILKKYDEKNIQLIGAVESKNKSQLKAYIKMKYRKTDSKRLIRIFGKSITF